MGIIYPSLFHMKLCKEQSSWQDRLLDMFVVAVGAALTILTTVQTLATWGSQSS